MSLGKLIGTAIVIVGTSIYYWPESKTSQHGQELDAGHGSGRTPSKLSLISTLEDRSQHHAKSTTSDMSDVGDPVIQEEESEMPRYQKDGSVPFADHLQETPELD